MRSWSASVCGTRSPASAPSASRWARSCAGSGRLSWTGWSDEPDYERQKAQLEFDLTALVVPEADAVAEAGRLVQRLPELWAAADLSERRRLLITVLDAVYVDVREARAVVSIRPKAAFDAVLLKLQQDAVPTQAWLPGSASAFHGM